MLQHTIKAVVYKGEKFFVAECFEINVTTQGRSIDETVENLKEAVALHLKDEDPEDFGLVKNPAILITVETEPLYAKTKSVVGN